MTLDPGACINKTYYDRNLCSSNNVPGKPFLSSLVIAGKVGAYPSEPFQVVHSRVGY
jgi:hypothetical protein